MPGQEVGREREERGCMWASVKVHSVYIYTLVGEFLASGSDRNVNWVKYVELKLLNRYLYRSVSVV